MENQLTLFTNRNFLSLWIAKIISLLGDKMYWVGLIWWAIENTGKTTEISMVLVIGSIPTVVLGPIAGVWIDRLPRKMLIIAADLVRAFIIGGFIFLLYFNNLSLLYVYLGVALTEIATCFHRSTIQTLLPSIVRDHRLTKANSLFQMSNSTLGVLGPALGGILVAKFGVNGVFILNAISFLLSAVIQLFFRSPSNINNMKKQSLKTDFIEGLKYIKMQKAILAMILISSIVSVFAYPVELFTPVLVKKFFNMGSKEVGFLWSAWSLGIFVASVMFAVFKELKKRHPSIVIGTLLIGCCFICTGLSQFFSLTLTIFCVFGIATVMSRLPAQVLIQSIVPDEKRGRVFGLLTTLNNSLHPIAFFIAGLLIDRIGISSLFIVNGCAIFLSALVLYSVKEIRQL